MGKKDWAPIAAAIASVITALLASLAGLGEHAPGVVGGLLIVVPVFYVYFQREKEITAERAARLAECQECEREQRAAGEKMVAALQAVSERMAIDKRDREISEQLAELVSDRKEREGHEDARKSRQDGRPAGRV